MTKMERRIKNFSSGIKQLSAARQTFIHKLTHYLFFIEKTSVCFIETNDGKEGHEFGKMPFKAQHKEN